jgi:hypothetical protein
VCWLRESGHVAVCERVGAGCCCCVRVWVLCRAAAGRAVAVHGKQSSGNHLNLACAAFTQDLASGVLCLVACFQCLCVGFALFVCLRAAGRAHTHVLAIPCCHGCQGLRPADSRKRALSCMLCVSVCVFSTPHKLCGLRQPAVLRCTPHVHALCRVCAPCHGARMHSVRRMRAREERPYPHVSASLRLV